MKPWSKCRGLIVATFTPMKQDGSINLPMIRHYIDFLNSQGVTQAYVNGTAAEFASLSVDERKALAETWVREGKGKMTRLIIQCGAGNLVDSKELAAHAQTIGADCVAVVLPTYFKPQNTDDAVNYCAEIAKSCPDTPFMYYHFPAITGVNNVRATDFLKQAGNVIPNLIGCKFTSTDMWDAGEALRLERGKYDVVIGAETSLISALAMGVDSAIGIAFSFLGRPCGRIFQAFHDKNLVAAREDQYRVQDFWSSTMTPGDFHSMTRNFKAIMGILGLDFGPTRNPIRTATAEEIDELRKALDRLNYDKWAGQ